MALLKGRLFAGALFVGLAVGTVTEPAGEAASAPVSGRVNGLTRSIQTDEVMRAAMRRSTIKREDEELMLLVATFVRTL